MFSMMARLGTFVCKYVSDFVFKITYMEPQEHWATVFLWLSGVPVAQW